MLALSSLCPQSWQNSEPSRLTFPQWVQRGIARLSSRVKLSRFEFTPPHPFATEGTAISGHENSKPTQRKQERKSATEARFLRHRASSARDCLRPRPSVGGLCSGSCTGAILQEPGNGRVRNAARAV